VTIESLAAGPPVTAPSGAGLPEVNDLAPKMVLPRTGPTAPAGGLLAASDGRLRLSSAQACQDYLPACFDWPVTVARGRGFHLEVPA
jgi:hypothetical protein